MTQNLRIGCEMAKKDLKSHLLSRNSTNNKLKVKNLSTTYIIPYIVIFKKKLGLNDSKSKNSTRNGQNRPKITFTFPKFNKYNLM